MPTSSSEGGGGGGSALWGALQGPTTFGTIGKLLSQRTKSGLQKAQALIASGALGTAIVGETELGRQARRAEGVYQKSVQNAVRMGLPIPTRPPIASFVPGSILSGVMAQNAGGGVPTATSSTSALPWWQQLLRGVPDAVNAGLALLDYYNLLFGSSGGGAGGYRRTIDNPPPTPLGGSVTVMPYLTFPSPVTNPDSGFLGGVGGLAAGIGSVISAIRGGQSSSMPGGAMMLGNYGSVGPYLGSGVRGMTSQAIMAAAGVPSSCSVGGAVGITNPATGRMVWFRRAGVPVLWSGDKAAAKRWHKCHGRRRSGGR